MIAKKMQDALNKHMITEMYSAYLYLSMAAYFDSKDLQGCAHWMKIQAKEEMGHAMKFYGYLNDRGGRIELGAIEAPKKEWKAPIEAFEDTLEHEKKVTAGIHKLVELAAESKDHPTTIFLQWFVKEQVEEEAAAELVLVKLKLVGADGRGLFWIDRELGSRSGD